MAKWCRYFRGVLPFLSGLFALVLACLVRAEAPPSKVFPVDQFGAIGDGVQNDGPAIRRAIATAIESGPGARLVFSGKTYRLDACAEQEYQIQLKGVSGLSLEGNGAVLVNHPGNGLLSLRDCTNVTVRGMVLDYSPLPFTQGTIRSVDAERLTLDFEVASAYALPPDDASYRQRFGAGGWDWGVVMDPAERHRRWEVRDHFFIKSVSPVREGGRVYRVAVTDVTAEQLRPVRPRDRFFLPLRFTARPGAGGGHGSNLSVQGSRDCLLEDITVYSGRSGMVCAMVRNEGRITLRGIRITFKPGTDRVVTTWRDGMHCKDNRVGPLIENCSFEGMLDDSINMGANTAMARTVISPTEFVLTDSGFQPGDEVLVVSPQTGLTLAHTRVRELRTQGNQRITVLADPVAGVVAGQKRPHVDIRATHFYNLSYCSADYIIRDCTFLPQRRHAMLVRAPNGLITGNTIDGVGGSGVHLANEIGSFYEGPFPSNVVISNNVIRHPQDTAIAIYTGLLSKEAQRVQNISVVNNRITVLPGKSGIRVNKAKNVVLSGNRIQDGTGKDLGTSGITVSASTNVIIR